MDAKHVVFDVMGHAVIINKKMRSYALTHRHNLRAFKGSILLCSHLRTLQSCVY